MNNRKYPIDSPIESKRLFNFSLIFLSIILNFLEKVVNRRYKTQINNQVYAIFQNRFIVL